MWLAAFVGMATKYAEILLGMVYRVKGDDGRLFLILCGFTS